MNGSEPQQAETSPYSHSYSRALLDWLTRAESPANDVPAGRTPSEADIARMQG